MSAAEGRKLNAEERRAWLHAKGAHRTGPHAFTWKVRHWLACARCGLLLLRNEATRRAAAQPCVWEE